jgi:hypothetical protein
LTGENTRTKEPDPKWVRLKKITFRDIFSSGFFKNQPILYTWAQRMRELKRSREDGGAACNLAGTILACGGFVAGAVASLSLLLGPPDPSAYKTRITGTTAERKNKNQKYPKNIFQVIQQVDDNICVGNKANE